MTGPLSSIARREAFGLAIACAVALAFAGFLSYTGIPALRHDWSWISGRGYFTNAWAVFSGWRTDGIGSPRPYPTDYLLIVANAGIVGAFGNALGYAIDVLLIGFAAAMGGMRLTAHWTPSLAAGAGAAAFAAFNPWAYNEVVAGHIYMVLAYAASMLLLAELLRPQWSQFRIGAFLVLSMVQLQFFLPALCAVAVWTVVRRERPWAWIVAMAAALPIWIGVAAERGYLDTIQYTLAWQKNASVPPLHALALAGYFARYADALPWFAAAAVWCAAALALAGAVTALANDWKRALPAVAAVVVVWTLVTGSDGIFANAYGWIVRSVPASGVYRELYDAVAFVSIGYVAGCAAFVCRIRASRWLWLACGAAAIAGWAVAPPARYWMPSQLLPAIRVDAPANTRYALLPPLQPIVYRWGAGLDPDAVALPSNVTPLNTQQFSDPESPALMRYALYGDARWLRALSVSRVIDRPAYSTDVNSLRYQLSLAPPRLHPVAQRSRTLDALAELTLASVPNLSAVPQPPWRNGIFFGDANGAVGPAVPSSWQGLPRVTVVRPPSSAVSAADGWVDARSAFVALPQLAQGLGGAITTDPRALLALEPNQWTLAAIDGRLESARGVVLSGVTRGYRWLAPWRSSRVRCIGRCVIVAQSGARYSRDIRTNGGVCRGAVPFALAAPWLLSVTLPSAPRCLLRYNVRYDRYWSAFAEGTRLGHVAIDSTFNGWIVPAHPKRERLVVVEAVAAAQFLAEVFGLLLLAAVSIQRACWR